MLVYFWQFFSKFPRQKFTVTCSFQPQGIDLYLTGDILLLSRLELFQALEQDFHECFGVCGQNRCDQGLFLFGQLFGFFYRLLRRIVLKSSSTAEEDWDCILCFNFPGCLFLAIAVFKTKSHFRTAAKASVDVE